jgi:hypothetical protein
MGNWYALPGRIIVESPADKITVDVGSTDTVMDLKQKIESILPGEQGS